MDDPKFSRGTQNVDVRGFERDALSLALEAAEAAAGVLMASAVHVGGVRPQVERKGPIDFVTEIDRESERTIVKVLARSGFPIVAEEGGGGRVDRRAFRSGPLWYVDPLDGTTNYAHGHPFHAVSIGLVVDGAPRVGVVRAPLLGVLWSGSIDLGATRSDLIRGLVRPLAVSTTSDIGDALLATGFPADRRTNDDDNLTPYRVMMKRAVGVMRCGSAAIDLSMVADGTYEAFWERRLKPWDLAAGAALVLAAGGSLSDPWGRDFRPEEGEMIASNGRIHGALVDALAPHFPAPPPRNDE